MRNLLAGLVVVVGLSGCHIFNGSTVADCGDHKQDGDESDVDCGGSSCMPCLPAGKCRSDADCASSACLQSRCEAVSGPPFWLPVTALPSARQDLATAGVDTDGRIYAVGGRRASGPLSSVDAYDPKTDRWSPAPSLPTPRSGLGLSLASNGALFAIGGTGASGPLATVDVLNARATVWNAGPPMATARAGLGVGHSNGFILAVGGDPAGGVVEAFDTNQWTARPTLPTARAELGLGPPFGNDQPLYAVGGRVAGGAVSTPVNTVESFDVKANQWTTAAPLATARFALAVSPGGDGRLYAIGGSDGSADSAEVEAFSQATGRWTRMPPLALARHGLSACLGSDGRLYAIGGATAGGPVDTVEAYGPRVTITPSSAAPGEVVSVSGDNFGANAPVIITLGLVSGSARTDAAGRLPPTAVTVDAKAAPGEREVDIGDFASGYGVKVTFTVR